MNGRNSTLAAAEGDKRRQMGRGLGWKHVCLVMTWIFVSSTACAQSPYESRTLFHGRNVYSPTIIYDQQDHRYKMWYGGWQSNSDYPHDKIYYRTSIDGAKWSSPVTELTPADIYPRPVHVNDPSVVKSLNGVTGKWQYTMFYTVCVFPCNSYSSNQIWSSVSSDGIHWTLHTPVIKTNGAAEPSAVLNNIVKRSVWAVYYSNTAESHSRPKHIFMAYVDGNRQVISNDRVVYSLEGAGVLANPEVRNISGIWHLFFNVYHNRNYAKRSTADIYLVTSSKGDSFSDSMRRPLVLNDPLGTICAAGAPAAVPFGDGRRFALLFGQARYSGNGQCDLSTFTVMKWSYRQ